MKHLTKAIMLLAICLLPGSAIAQAVLQAEFDRLINCPQATITQTHSLERDVATRQKTSQSDVYNFKLPMSKRKLVDNILDAFKTDAGIAYSFESGNAKSQNQEVALAIGDGSRSLLLASGGRDYIYATFLAPESENPEGIYRYAYGMSWQTDGDQIVGTLGVTYATTLKYRQQQESRYSDRRPKVVVQQPEEPWFNMMAYYVMGFLRASKNDRKTYATRIYEHSKQCANDSTVTDIDKATARKIISDAISSKNENNDAFVLSLMNSAIENIK